MLNLMRKHARNWLMIILLGIIIIVFIFYFGSLREQGGVDSIATIDGKIISYADYQREYEKLIDLYRSRLGQNLSDEILKGLKLKEQAFENLIKQAIILATAEEMNISASDEEVRNAIFSYPAFQRDGKFDKKIYEQTLRLNKMTLDNFEDVQRKILITTKLQELIISGIHVSDREVFDLYKLQKEKINVAFIKLSPKDYRKQVQTTRQLLEAFLKEKGNEFRIPEQVQVKYISFPASAYASKVEVTESDIRDYYDRNKEKLAKSGGKTPSLEQASEQIAAQLRQKSGMQRASEEAKKAHDIIYQQENFDGFATEKGLKVSLTPLFSTKNIPPEFQDIVDFSKNIFSLQKGEASRPLSDRRGYYLFQIAARKPSYIPDLKEAEMEVKDRYTTNQAKLLCQKEAENLLGRLNKGEVLEKIASEMNSKVEETGLFLPGANIPVIGFSQQLTDALVQLSEARPYPDKVFDVDDNFIIVRFKERGTLDQGDFRSQKEEMKRIFKELKKSETISVWMEGVKASLIKEGRLKISKEMKDI